MRHTQWSESTYICIYIYIFFLMRHAQWSESTRHLEKSAMVLPLLWSKSEALSMAYLLAVQRPFLLGTYGVT